jgi:crotonobetainyl-CoA:carnitine CoA-transferase CaiB-like acyl-CoA transferase
MASALERLTVIDLSSHLSGPYCAMLLADHGADVIKVEKPGGDEARGMPPFMAGESAPFMIWNRNKRSVVIDLKTAVGKAQLLALIDKADVLIENFRPGTLDRLGLGWSSLRERNPRLIYAAISGFGQTGPYRARGGFDLITQGMSGLMSVCGPKDGPPHRLPIAISDVAAGMHLAVGVLAALEARHHTGCGQLVETSLLEAALSLGVYEAAHVAATGAPPAAVGPSASRQFALSGVSDQRRLDHRRGGARQLLGEALRPVGDARTQGRCAVCHQRRPCAQQRRADRPARTPLQGQTLRALARPAR